MGTLGTMLRLITASAIQFLGLIASRQLRLRRDRVGQTYDIGEHGPYQIFRETVSAAAPANGQAALLVGFHLRALPPVAPLRWLFERLCILTTPFWSGFRGFCVKLWMVNPQSSDYMGIYDWAGADLAKTYLDVLIPILHRVSSPGSVWYELYTDQEFEPFLDELRQGATPGIA